MMNPNAMRKGLESQKQEKLASVQQETASRYKGIEQNKRLQLKRAEMGGQSSIKQLEQRLSEFRSQVNSPDTHPKKKSMLQKAISQVRSQIESVKERVRSQKRGIEFQAKMQKENVEINYGRTKSNLLRQFAEQFLRVGVMEQQMKQAQMANSMQNKEAGKMAG